jgi:hypothetical protein
VLKTLTITIDERARSAFFSHYVSGFSKTYDILETLYKQSSVDGHLAASLDAVSFAFFSFQFAYPPASHLARQKYSHALPLLNKALKSTESATSDPTLLAVLLLDLFEKITNKNPRSTDSWMCHVNGALALVRLRDSSQFRNYAGLRLSVRLSTNLLISCVAANAPVPPALIKLRSDLEPFLNRYDPKWQVSGLVVKYANLQVVPQKDCVSNSDIITRTTELDFEFMLLAKTMPSTWLFKTTYLEEASEGVLEQHYDTYADHFVAQTWNVLRIMRILLNDIMRTYCIEMAMQSHNDASSFRHWDIATTTIDSMARDICAAAPQYTMYGNVNPEIKNNSPIRRIQCYTLLFPFYVAGLYASSTTKIKPWIIKQLRFMSKEMGIGNASIVAEILERGDGISPWSVYAILGSYAFSA